MALKWISDLHVRLLGCGQQWLANSGSVFLIRILLPLCFLWLKHFLSWFSYHCSVLHLPPFLCSFFRVSGSSSLPFLSCSSSVGFHAILLVLIFSAGIISINSWYYQCSKSVSACLVSQDPVRFYRVSFVRCMDYAITDMLMSGGLCSSPYCSDWLKITIRSLHCAVLSAPQVFNLYSWESQALTYM